MHLPLDLTAQLPVLTGRLRLVEMDLSHLPALAAMLADPIVMRHFPRAMSLAESEQWLRRNTERYRLHGTGLFAVLREDDGSQAFIGDCGLVVRHFGERMHLELGYHFVRQAWHQGFASEAARACVEIGFRHTEAAEVVALIRPENAPSQAVARRLGMRPEGALLYSGLVHDVWRMHREAFAGDALQ